MASHASQGRARKPAALHGVALLTLLTFGCTTVRVPASAIAPTVAVRAGAAEPQVELWLESARLVSSEESARAVAEARAALHQAVAERQVADGDAILVVRAQGVSRTRSRRNDQHAAVAGIVVGAVALVAVAVVALVASKGDVKVPSLRGGAVARASPHVPVVRPPRPLPVPIPVAPAPRPRAFPPMRPGPGAPELGGRVDADVELVLMGPEPPADAPPDGEESQAAEPGAPWHAPTGGPPDLAPVEIASVTLPPPRPLDVEGRGFFDGDQLRLELVLVDRRGGNALWVKSVEDNVDVRDARAVRKLLDRALGDPSGWSAPARDPAAY